MSERTTETQKGRILEYKDFDLRKIKMERKGADVTHHEGGSDGGIVTKIGETIPHPDLQESLDKLKGIMARRLGLLEGTDIALEVAKGDLPKYEKVLEKEKEIIKRCNVKGLTFVGAGDKYGVMITGSIYLPGDGSVGLATSKISFSSDDLGIEEETEKLCELVKKEVYAYRFQNKKAQLDIVTESEKQEAEWEAKAQAEKENQESSDDQKSEKENEPLDAVVVDNKPKGKAGRKKNADLS